MYWPLFKVCMTLETVGCSIMEQRVRSEPDSCKHTNRRARVHVACGRTLVSSKQTHVIRTRLQIRYGFLYGTSFSRSTSLRLLIVLLNSCIV